MTAAVATADDAGRAQGREAVSHSAEQTQALGRNLAAQLSAGDVVAFRGDLGTGKTCMIQGICAELEVADVVNSPTFILINHYSGRLAERKIAVYHFDLYRLGRADELEDLGADEFFSGDGLCLIEWAERAWERMPTPRWEVDLAHAGGDVRRICWRYAPGRALAEPSKEGVR